MINYVSCKVDRNIFYGCTVHFDIYKVQKPPNALLLNEKKVLKFTLKNHSDLLLHVSVYDHRQEVFTTA